MAQSPVRWRRGGLRGLAPGTTRGTCCRERAGSCRRLSQHPFVAEVRYRVWRATEVVRFAKKQMDGFGAILCVTLDTDAAGARNVVEALKLWTPATSLGGVESLVRHVVVATGTSRIRFRVSAAPVGGY